MPVATCDHCETDFIIASAEPPCCPHCWGPLRLITLAQMRRGAHSPASAEGIWLTAALISQHAAHLPEMLRSLGLARESMPGLIETCRRTRETSRQVRQEARCAWERIKRQRQE